SDDRDDLAPPDVEAHLAERVHGAEANADAFHLEERRPTGRPGRRGRGRLRTARRPQRARARLPAHSPPLAPREGLGWDAARGLTPAPRSRTPPPPGSARPPVRCPSARPRR